MIQFLSGGGAILLYLCLPVALVRKEMARQWLPALAIAALLAHGWYVQNLVFPPTGPVLDLPRVTSLIFLFISLLTLVNLSRGKAIASLVPVVFPLAGASVLLSLLVPVAEDYRSSLGLLATVHALLSILAYSTLTIAALQALSLALLEQDLKRRRTSPLLTLLPPLQTLEELLFEHIWLGVILLSLSILSGALFLDELMRTPGLIHKTILSLIAWAIFATLLWGRHRKGWRSTVVVRYSLGGFAALVLAYFGSRWAIALLWTMP